MATRMRTKDSKAAPLFNVVFLRYTTPQLHYDMNIPLALVLHYCRRSHGSKPVCGERTQNQVLVQRRDGTWVYWSLQDPTHNSSFLRHSLVSRCTPVSLGQLPVVLHHLGTLPSQISRLCRVDECLPVPNIASFAFLLVS